MAHISPVLTCTGTAIPGKPFPVTVVVSSSDATVSDVTSLQLVVAPSGSTSGSVSVMKGVFAITPFTAVQIAPSGSGTVTFVAGCAILNNRQTGTFVYGVSAVVNDDTGESTTSNIAYVTCSNIVLTN